MIKKSLAKHFLRKRPLNCVWHKNTGSCFMHFECHAKILFTAINFCDHDKNNFKIGMKVIFNSKKFIFIEIIFKTNFNSNPISSKLSRTFTKEFLYLNLLLQLSKGNWILLHKIVVERKSKRNLSEREFNSIAMPKPREI